MTPVEIFQSIHVIWQFRNLGFANNLPSTLVFDCGNERAIPLLCAGKYPLLLSDTTKRQKKKITSSLTSDLALMLGGPVQTTKKKSQNDRILDHSA